VRGRPLIEHLLAAFPAAWPKVFVLGEHHRDTDLAATLARLAPDARIVWIPSHRKGPAFAILEARRVDPDAFDDGEPCLLNYCDFGFEWDPAAFEAMVARTRCDGAVLCYTGFHPEYLRPTEYAYCREDAGRILEIREKGHFTDDRTREWASSGSYWFRTGDLMVRYCRRLMDEGPLLNGEGYASLVCQAMVADGLHVRVHAIPRFFQWGTPEDLADFEHWAGVFDRFPWAGPPGRAAPDAPLQLLVPMAGRGSRFAGEVPKPLLPVLGRPMFTRAIDHLPPAARRVLVVRAGMEEAVSAADPDARLVVLPGVTEGQAITCAAAAPELDPDLPLLVSNSDHGMSWDASRLRALLADGPDVVVWGQRGYPGSVRTPKAFAWIATIPGTDRVARVSVKVPLSDRPRGDLLLPGTFWFRRPALMLDAIRELVARDLRVNGEFYLDSVVNVCVERGLDVRAFEADGYLCWGTPDALREYEWWHQCFAGL
jgi:NDP-sugar pyrophosphorylase family protein